MRWRLSIVGIDLRFVSGWPLFLGRKLFIRRVRFFGKQRSFQTKALVFIP